MLPGHHNGYINKRFFGWFTQKTNICEIWKLKINRIRIWLSLAVFWNDIGINIPHHGRDWNFYGHLGNVNSGTGSGSRVFLNCLWWKIILRAITIYWKNESRDQGGIGKIRLGIGTRPGWKTGRTLVPSHKLYKLFFNSVWAPSNFKIIEH